jgi:FKBP-type peptidyl-prolyl cis-trans isomerase FkpA
MLRKFIAFALLVVIAASCTKDEVVDYGPIDKKIIETYLTAHSLTAESTSSGLYYIIENPGGTNHPNILSKVSVNYQGFLTDGTMFDSYYGNGQPYTQALSSLVKGWQEGLQLIGVGGKIKLFIPSTLGYGSTALNSNYATIPANSVLVFNVELVEYY